MTASWTAGGFIEPSQAMPIRVAAIAAGDKETANENASLDHGGDCQGKLTLRLEVWIRLQLLEVLGNALQFWACLLYTSDAADE